MLNRNNVDNNLRLSRISEEKLNISVDGISSARGNKSIIDQDLLGDHMNKSQIVGGIDDDKILLRGLRDHSNDQQQSSQA